MNTRRLKILATIVALLALGGCATNGHTGYSHDKPIMSAADAASMIRVEVRAIEPAPAETVLVAASDLQAP